MRSLNSILNFKIEGVDDMRQPKKGTSKDLFLGELLYLLLTVSVTCTVLDSRMNNSTIIKGTEREFKGVTAPYFHRLFGKNRAYV